MENSRLELPPPAELAEWLRKTRVEHDVTQTELADRLDMSPSQISRIESQRGGANYETVYGIQQALLAITDSEANTRVTDILSEKNSIHSPEYELAYIRPNDTIETVVDVMEELSISQLPVIDKSGQAVGRVTERDLLDSIDPTSYVRKHMRTPFPEVSADAPASIARDLLETNEAVLITPATTDQPAQDEHPYLGILTPSDFTQTNEF